MRQLKAGDRFFKGKSVRLISSTNTQLGVVSFEEALARAENEGVDLVEMPSKTDPPVCKIMNYGKFLFDEAKRQREAKKAQIQQKIKEVKMGLTIDDNDFQIKLKRAVEFLNKGDKVRLLLAFRGREMAHPEIGEQLMDKMIKGLEAVSVIDSPAKRMGRNIIAVLAPTPEIRKNLAKQAKVAKEAKEARNKGEEDGR